MRRTIFMAIIVFAAALAGVFAGRALVKDSPQAENELHALLHRQLDLDASQHRKIEQLEKQFAIRRKALELDMRADNARLAAAIDAEHGYGPKVNAAIDHSHIVMGALQKETLEHIFAMRAVLRPNQAKRFDEAVVNALTAPAK